VLPQIVLICEDYQFGDYDIFNKHWQLTFVTFHNSRTSAIFNSSLDRQSNVVERLINLLKRFRRIGNRYEKPTDRQVAMAIPAMNLDWLSESLQTQPGINVYNVICFFISDLRLLEISQFIQAAVGFG